jgi:hypothetical protein
VRQQPPGVRCWTLTGPTSRSAWSLVNTTARSDVRAVLAGIRALGLARGAARPQPGCPTRTFLYRRRDLLEKIHALQAEPAVSDGVGPAVTRASLQADLIAAHQRAIRLSTHPRPAPGNAPVRGTRRPGMARVRARRPGRYRCPQPEDHALEQQVADVRLHSKNAMTNSPLPAPPTVSS